MGDRSLAWPTLENTDTENTKIFIHVINGVRTLDLRVWEADDRPLDYVVQTCTTYMGVEVELHSFLGSAVDELHGTNEEKKLLQ
jgi:hypothetical protein